MRDVLKYLVEHQAGMLADLQRFVEAESPATSPVHTKAFAQLLRDRAEELLPCRVDVVTTADGREHVRIEIGPRASGKGILVLGHFDTVWPVGSLATMPFRIEDGIARGPGIFDMKGGLVQGLWALKGLLDVVGGTHRVVYLCTSDEELGSPRSRELVEMEACQARAALVLEPSQDGALKTARKGVGRYRVEVTGRAAHAGLDAEAGISAINGLSGLVIRITGLASPERGTTLNVGRISGGTAVNVVAGHAEAEVDVRVVTAAEAERVDRALHALSLDHPEAGLRVSGGFHRPPMPRTDEAARLFGLARALARDLGFEVDEVSSSGGSDGNLCAAVGLPVLDGLGAVGDGAHAPDEHILVDHMPRRAALVAALIDAINSERITLPGTSGAAR